MIAERCVIVDLAVCDDRRGSVLIVDGLVARFEIYDHQTAMPEDASLCVEHSRAVGTAVYEALQHQPYESLIPSAPDANDAAHQRALSSERRKSRATSATLRFLTSTS
jgi:hypothetical protein